MKKTDIAELSKLITSELVTYLGSGELNSDRLAASIDYSGLDIDDFDRLKDLHFVLYEDVVKYVNKLESRLRQVKTVHQRAEEVTHGEVRGPVNWERTLQERPKTGDPSLFIISNPEIEFDIPENRVVKKLIGVIAGTLGSEVEGSSRSWAMMWDDADIVELQRTLKRNVYLDQLSDAEEIHVTDRDLNKARRSRHLLYSEGARLFRLWDDLRNDRYNRPGIQSLLRQTIITPSYPSKIFELFCVFGEINRLREEYPDLALQPIEPGMEEIALLESEARRISIYWDQGGPLSFFSELHRPEELRRRWRVPEGIIRNSEALKRHEELLEDFLETGAEHSFYQGRPDLIITEYQKAGDSEDLTRVHLGEMKYRQSPEGFSAGLRELLEYLYFARKGDEYLFGEALPRHSIQGILYTDEVETEAYSVGNITHRTTSELRTRYG